MELINRFDNAANDVLNNVYRKPKLIRGVIHMLIILYAARIAPAMPSSVLKLFDNVYFKLFVFSLILWTAQFSPSTSLMVALAFMISVNLLNERGALEFMDNVRDEIFRDAQPEFMDNVIGSEYLEGMTNTPGPSPSTSDVINNVVNRVNNMATNTPVVTQIAEKKDTIVIAPQVINTPSGPTVVNPTVVISPAVVATPQGEKIIVSPNVNTITKSHTHAADTPEESCYPVRKVDITNVTGIQELEGASFNGL